MALEVQLNGAELVGVQTPSLLISHQIDSVSSCSFRMKGQVAGLVLPVFGDEVDVVDTDGNVLLFRGDVRYPKPAANVIDGWVDTRVRCVGRELRLRNTLIQNSDGISIAEMDRADDQFEALVDLVDGFTASTDIGAGNPVTRDIRYSTVGRVLRQLVAQNDCFFSVTPAGAVTATTRSNLPAASLATLTGDEVRGMTVIVDPRHVRSRQFVRYGASTVSRTIAGDGATREFSVADVQAPTDYMEDSAEARPLNSDSGDHGLRFRADADAAARTGGGIDFFGGNAADSATGLYVGTALSTAASVELAMLTDGKLQLRADGLNDSAAGYGIALRHDGTGAPVWTSSGITPTVETEVGAMTRDAGRDFTLGVYWGNPHRYARHGNTIILRFFGRLYGFRVSGAAAVRDSRFDVSSGIFGPETGAMFFIGDVLYIHSASGGSGRLQAFRITAGSLTPLPGEDVDGIAAVANRTPNGFTGYGFHWNGKVYLSRDGVEYAAYDPPSGGAMTRSSADDLSLGSVSWPQLLDRRVASNAAHWHDGDYLYLIRQGASGVSNAFRLGRVNLATLTADPTGVLVSNLSSRVLLGFGGHVFVGMNFGAVVPGTIGSNQPTAFQAVKVSESFLQWDAPSADYSTLNTRRQADPGFRVAVMDPDIFGVSVAGAEFSPIPVDVRSVSRIEINGTQEDIGEDHDWRFNKATQKIIQSPDVAALGSSDTLVVTYFARSIAQACDPTAAATRDVFLDLPGSEGMTHEEAVEIATDTIERFGPLVTRVEATLRPGLDHHFDVGSKLGYDAMLLLRYGVSNAHANDEWAITAVRIRTAGMLTAYSLDVQRGHIADRWSDWWRDRDPEDVG